MKLSLRFCTFLLLLTSLLAVTPAKGVEGGSLAKGFVVPADSMQTAVYWYWMQGNVSQEGVVKDLLAMKAAGINRAFIGNMGGDYLGEVPQGKVKLLSEEWWKVLHATLKTASQLNIEIGIFNSPGWSQSGGPWIKPEQAMRYLTASELTVKGPKQLSQKLEKPTELFQDVKVLAYPAPKDNRLVLNTTNGAISSVPVVPELSKISDGDQKTGIELPIGKEFTLYFEAKKPFTARSLTLRTTEFPMYANALLQVKEMDGTYRTLSEFEISRSNPALNVGFEPYSPVVVSFPATKASSFRLVLQNPNANSGLAEVALSAAPRVQQYSEKKLAKMFPSPLPFWKEYQWKQQTEVDDKATVVDPTKVIDITTHVSADGTLNWKVPSGEWILLRTGMTPTGTKNGPASVEGTGYEVDKMSKVLIEKHFDAFIGEILKRIPADDRKSFKVVVADSYEMGGQNFTDDFLEAFHQKYRYDALPYLPVYQGMVVKSQLASDRFLWDMRRMVADKVAYDYVGGLREVSHKNGLSIWLENYGHWGFPGEFLMYGGQSDEVAGEFWSEGELGNIECRAATSCAHIYGKTKISAESFTCGGAAFSRYPATIKQRGDRFFAEGINNTLLSVYISQLDDARNPGINVAFGDEFNRKNTWFSQMGVYTPYLKRTNYMLQQGLNVADVAYFIGEDTPKMTGITDPALPVGYQFDYMNAEVIEKYMTVKDGLLTLPHGTQYRILVLPKLETMRPELLAKIQQLVNDGAIVMGPAPMRSPSLQNQPMADQLVLKMAKELWGNVDGVTVTSRKVGKGMILNGLDMKQAFSLLNCLPDCNLPEDNTVHYGHRTTVNGEIYFISNQTTESKVITPEFRVRGLQPELWEATTGSIRPLPAFTQNGKTTAVPLKLAPNESVFVVFQKAGTPTAKALEANYPAPMLSTVINTPWKVTFDSQYCTPKPIVMPQLQNLSSFTNDSIRYFSGTATYSNTFQLDNLSEPNTLFIRLDTVSVMAKVSINGQFVGGVWTKPYQLDITNYVKQGANEVEIEVVNTWVNRLIGDQQLPESQRQTKLNVNPYNAQSPLQSSGLGGKITIERYKKIAVE